MENYSLYWWRGNDYNFGDEITPWLFGKMCDLFQDRPCNISSEKKTVVLAVGSIMRLSSQKTVVWGSGIRNIDQSDFSRAKQYFAVRGPFTRNRLLTLGYSCPPIYGDPGLLLPRYYTPAVKKKFKLGIIPHISEYDDLKKAYSKFPEVNIISLKTGNIEKVVDEICKCESTLSTSLHGIITSIAYGIPTRWLKYSNRITGDDIKFYDFFSSLDPTVFSKFEAVHKRHVLEKYSPLSFSNNLNVLGLVSKTFKYDIHAVDLDKLLDSCPIKVKHR
jgi:hypothetical protein